MPAGYAQHPCGLYIKKKYDSLYKILKKIVQLGVKYVSLHRDSLFLLT